MSAGHGDVSSASAVLRVATANCLHGLDVRHGAPGPADEAALDALAGTLAGLEADVIALQEVDRHLARSDHVDQVAWLADRLGMHGVFAPALLGDPDRSWRPVPDEYPISEVTDPHPASGAYGIGLLSAFPIEAVHRRRLPGGRAGTRQPARRTTADGPPRPGWDFEPRVALRADIRTPSGVVAVTTAHLSYLPWRGLRQLIATGALAAAGDATAVVLGDFNLPPWAVRAALPGWRHAGGAETYPAAAPRMQVDHILVRGAVSAGVARPAGPLTSDHLPLVAVLPLRHTVR